MIAMPALATIYTGRSVDRKTFSRASQRRNRASLHRSGQTRREDNDAQRRTMSRLPSVLMVRWIMSITTDSSETSPGTASTRRGSFPLIALTTSSSAGVLVWPFTAISYPSSASWSAIARPIPREAPVIKATPLRGWDWDRDEDTSFRDSDIVE